MKTLLNYFKRHKKQKVKFDLNCEVVYLEAKSIPQLCDKINNSDAKQGVNAASIVTALIYVQAN